MRRAGHGGKRPGQLRERGFEQRHEAALQARQLVGRRRAPTVLEEDLLGDAGVSDVDVVGPACVDPLDAGFVGERTHVTLGVDAGRLRQCAVEIEDHELHQESLHADAPVRTSARRCIDQNCSRCRRAVRIRRGRHGSPPQCVIDGANQAHHGGNRWRGT